jgi:hypothetical protein
MLASAGRITYEQWQIISAAASAARRSRRRAEIERRAAFFLGGIKHYQRRAAETHDDADRRTYINVATFLRRYRLAWRRFDWERGDLRRDQRAGRR